MHARQRRLGLGNVFSLIVLASLAGTLGACQTTNSGTLTEREQSILDSQRALVRTALDSGKPEQALQSIRELLREYPEDAAMHNLMGLTQLALRNPDRSALHFRKAYKLNPEGSVALNLSSAYIENGDYDKAIQLLKSLLKPRDEATSYKYKERVLHNIGYAHVRQNQLAKAQHWLKEALAENPTFFPSHLELARLHERQNRPSLAIQAYRTSMDYCHVCFEPVKALSKLYLQTNRQAEARQLLLRFSRVDGVEPRDRLEAERLLRVATVHGIHLPPKTASDPKKSW